MRPRYFPSQVARARHRPAMQNCPRTKDHGLDPLTVYRLRTARRKVPALLMRSMEQPLDSLVQADSFVAWMATSSTAAQILARRGLDRHRRKQAPYRPHQPLQPEPLPCEPKAGAAKRHPGPLPKLDSKRPRYLHRRSFRPAALPPPERRAPGWYARKNERPSTP